MKILVTGASGQVGSEVVDELERRNLAMGARNRHDVIGASRSDLDITKRDQVFAAVLTTTPDVILHPAAFTAVDACETDPDHAFQVNALGTRFLAEAAATIGAHFLYVSTDYVFDGTSTDPYQEWDRPNPQSVYGRSKLAGEAVLDPSATIVRTSWVCGRRGSNMVKTVLRLSGQGDGPLHFVNDQFGSPTIAHDLARVLIDLALERHRGIVHVTNQGTTTWFDFARSVVAWSGGDPGRVQPITTEQLVPPRPAPRPSNSVLDNAVLRLSGYPLLPSWQESTAALVAHLLTS